MKKLSSFKKIIPIFGTGLILLGLALLFVPPYIRGLESGTESFPALPDKSNYATVTDQPGLIEGRPRFLEIPELGINLEVIDGVFSPAKREWTLTRDKAQHAIMTVGPNNKEGLTFIYGHNRAEVFSRLPKIKPGMRVKITADNGHAFIYEYRFSWVTKPEDTQVFSYAGSPILVLQTCTGVFFQNRQLFQFDLVEAS